MEQQLTAKEQEVERTQRELYQSKLDFEDRIKKLNDELDAFRTREHDILAVRSTVMMVITMANHCVCVCPCACSGAALAVCLCVEIQTGD